MSWLGRLFGRPAAPAASPRNSVVIPDDVADVLTRGGAPLGDVVEGALRSHIDALTVVIPADLADALTSDGASLTTAVERAARDHLAAAVAATQRVATEVMTPQLPFWVTGGGGGSGDLEDALRDRIAQRRSGDEGVSADSPPRSADRPGRPQRG